MSPFTTGTSTSSYTNTISNDTYGSHGEYVKDYQNFIIDQLKPKKFEPNSKLGQAIFNKLFKEIMISPISIALYMDENSELYGDVKEIKMYYYDTFITTPNKNKISLHCYDICIIDGVIDQAKSTMQKGNIIKEALQSLAKDRGPTCLIISSKKMRKEELESTALFAGATKIIDAECLKDLEHACIVVM